MDTITETTIQFDRLPDGTLAALLTIDGQTVAAIVHPRRDNHAPERRWVLAGDVPKGTHRPAGLAPSGRQACAEAAQALGTYLGVTITAYEVA